MDNNFKEQLYVDRFGDLESTRCGVMLPIQLLNSFNLLILFIPTAGAIHLMCMAVLEFLKSSYNITELYVRHSIKSEHI